MGMAPSPCGRASRPALSLLRCTRVRHSPPVPPRHLARARRDARAGARADGVARAGGLRPRQPWAEICSVTGGTMVVADASTQHRCQADAGVHLGHCPLCGRSAPRRPCRAGGIRAGAHRRRRRASSALFLHAPRASLFVGCSAARAHHRFPAERSRPAPSMAPSRAMPMARANAGHRHAPRWVRPHCSRIMTSSSFPAVPWCLGAAALAAAAFDAPAHAQGVATEQQLAPCSSAATACAHRAADVPSNSASKTAEDLREQNLFNPEDALKYVPNTSIRKRYIGDRNSMIGGRSTGTLQPSRGGLRRRLPDLQLPRPLRRPALEHDHARGDRAGRRAVRPVLGDLPGNSIGTTVVTTEREPRGLRPRRASPATGSASSCTTTRPTTTAISSRPSSAAGSTRGCGTR